ncbi:TPA: hypothetical protein NNW70_004190 [Salmonella enterica]|nr:hypothetical protein [Salmonella enterica]HCH9607900.1 hypothetical protein [Salmonella enterica]HDI5000194.1 hypothetical protein [Salmonella enterica]
MKEYTEVSIGTGLYYREMVVPKDGVRKFIKQGWRITRFAKVQPNKIYDKWKNAIDVMESE